MTPEQWQQVKELFQSALELEPEQRPAYLDAACGIDPSLRGEVESLLEADEGSERFIERPALAFSAELMADRPGELVYGSRIGHYQVLREIGHGGMGIVYLAARADDQYRKQVAIKIVKRGLDTDDIRHRFRYERQILSDLDHPHIAKLLDGGTTEDGLPYFAMDYVEGLSINEYCNRDKLSIGERLELFRQVCSAVQYAHQHLVIHRDLKPGNILVTREGVPKLLDFGIAKVLDAEQSGSTRLTVTGLHVMTPQYASPEQVRGEQVTTASDIYSLGVLLYELLSGHTPYRVKSRRSDELLHMICEDEPESPSTAVSRVEETSDSDGAAAGTMTPQRVGADRGTQPEILRRRLSGDLDNFVLMALRKEPERRYKSVGEFSEDIRRHLVGMPVMARRDTFLYRAGKFAGRHKVGVAAGALLGLAIVASIVGIVWQARVASGHARVAAEQRDRARTEALKAKQINSFLQGMLGSADPSGMVSAPANGKQLTVVEVLDTAAKNAQDELANQPEVLAAVERTIGWAYVNQARYDEAEQLERSAVEIDRKHFGGEGAEFAESELYL